ncbi:MAG: hypothetical protein HYZ15_10365 [Sphingobacteriales bacterium]|nr:hypothetical protein [Sphingobacteriales bacterium]
MKKIFMNNRLIAIAFMTVFTAAFAPAAVATEHNPALPAEVKYVGKIQNNPVFELTVTGTGVQEDYVINVRDEHGNILHTENIKAESFTKKFMLALEELGDYSIQFQITGRKSKRTAVYSVNNNNHNVEEVRVSKL